MIFEAWIFFIVFIVGLLLAVKNKRITKLDTSLFIVTMLMYYLLAYLFDNEMLSPFIFTKDSFMISSLGIILLVGTFLLLRYVINKFKGISS
ncbi:hypothetical protein [Bacillus sp. REN16]|uniref:hypothetical protein n=1 Tax=Bacillus sp. REN16 TaxID=2887296 RepID=UPI001E2EC2F2|nr:hypothetical protein [Bacillus sp. REN16]MCC3357061.1 hypothetical protein [Bacillus sp. REN16]